MAPGWRGISPWRLTDLAATVRVNHEWYETHERKSCTHLAAMELLLWDHFGGALRRSWTHQTPEASEDKADVVVAGLATVLQTGSAIRS